jgi:uncharacterized membrane protein YjjP (DUF1212 family)
VSETTQTIEIPHVSMQELRERGELPSTKEGLAIELAMRVGDVLASAGASAKDTVVMMRRICQAYGLDRAQLDINLNMIMASYYPGQGMPPFTAIRTVSPVVSNLTKVSKVNALVREIGQGLSITRATKKFDRIRKSELPYHPLLAALAAGGISMSVQLFFTRDVLMLMLALITGFLVNRFVYLLKEWGLPTFFQQLFGGWLVIAIAAGFTWLNAHPDLGLGYISPTTIAVGCIFQLVVGARFVAGVQDAIDGFYVTATARILEVVLLTAGLVIGLLTGLDLARRLGINVYLSTSVLTPQDPAFQLIAATTTALLWAISRYANIPTLIMTAVTTLIARATFLLVQTLDASTVIASFAGPMVAAFIATILVRRFHRIPTFGVINAMGVPFVPGMALYMGLLQTVGTNNADPDPSLGGTTLGTAAAVALAIAAGASLGIFFGRPVSERLMMIPRTWNQLLNRGTDQAPKHQIANPAGGKLKHLKAKKQPDENPDPSTDKGI